MGWIIHFFSIFFAMWIGFALFGDSTLEDAIKKHSFSFGYAAIVLILSVGIIILLQLTFVQARGIQRLLDRIKDLYCKPLLYTVGAVLSVFFIQRACPFLVPPYTPTGKVLFLIPIVFFWIVAYEICRHRICGSSICNIYQSLD